LWRFVARFALAPQNWGFKYFCGAGFIREICGAQKKQNKKLSKIMKKQSAKKKIPRFARNL